MSLLLYLKTNLTMMIKVISILERFYNKNNWRDGRELVGHSFKMATDSRIV